MIQQWMNRWMINRTKVSMSEIEFELQMAIFQSPLKLLRLRNTLPALGFDSQLAIVDSSESQLNLMGTKKGKRRHFMPN
jgi:hypothetical protein